MDSVKVSDILFKSPFLTTFGNMARSILTTN